MSSTKLPDFGATVDECLDALLEYHRMWGDGELPEGEDPKQGIEVLLGILAARLMDEYQVPKKAD